VSRKAGTKKKNFKISAKKKKNPHEAETQAVVKGNTAFALDLYQALSTVGENVFFSPYGISTALAMTYAGARARTESEMAAVLHFTLPQERLHVGFASLASRLNAVQASDDVQLRIANSLWPQKDYPFLEIFLALVQQHYGVSTVPVDYQDTETARQQINTWVQKKTARKIKNLIAPGILNDLTRLVLTNAVYFKGQWLHQFDPSLTEEMPFWVTPEKTVPVLMMTQKRKYRYAETDILQMLELPYMGADLSFLILLPKKINGLKEIETDLSEDNLNQWISRLWRREVSVFLPRFKLNAQFRLNDTLKSLGMKEAFDADTANFSAMDGKKNWLYISDVIHQAFIDLNEEGSEAAAATAVVMRVRCPSPPPVSFRADRPFIFLIREKLTGSILFLGRTIDPTNEQ